MQDAALNFLRQVRSTLEAAERGLITEDGLCAGRNSMNELLDLDWVMPRAIAEVSMYWKVIEDALRAALGRPGASQTYSEDLQTAWTAYQNMAEVFEGHQ